MTGLRHRRGQRRQRLRDGVYEIPPRRPSRSPSARTSPTTAATRRLRRQGQRRRHGAGLLPATSAAAGDDGGTGIAVDSAGNAYVIGCTQSDRGHLPRHRRPGPHLQRRLRTPSSPRSTPPAPALVYAGYIGGSGVDVGNGIAVDSAGNAYVTGWTLSASHFPVTVGPRLTYSGVFDAFVAKVNPAGTTLLYAGYIGGTGTTRAPASPWTARAMPMSPGLPSSNSGHLPGHRRPGSHLQRRPVRRLRRQGERHGHARWSTPAIIGGIGTDKGYGIAVDSGGNAYVAGPDDFRPGDLPGARRPGPHPQRRPGRLRRQGQPRRHRGGLRRLYRRHRG